MAGEPRSSAERIAGSLTARGQTLATAEAASSGAVAFALTAIPGASRFFAGGVIAGGSRAWPAFGLPIGAAASSEVARAARGRMGADLGLCVGPRSRGGRATAVALVGPGLSLEDVIELAPEDDAQEVGARVLALAACWLTEGKPEG